MVSHLYTTILMTRFQYMYFDAMNNHTTTSDFSFVLCMPLFMDIAIAIYRKKDPITLFLYVSYSNSYNIQTCSE